MARERFSISEDFYFLHLMWKSKFFILGVTLAVALATFALLRSPLFKPKYECNAYVTVEGSTPLPPMLFDSEDTKLELVIAHGSLHSSLADNFSKLTITNFDSRVKCHEQRSGNSRIWAADETPENAKGIVEHTIKIMQHKADRFGQKVLVVSEPQVSAQPVALNTLKITFFTTVLAFVFSALIVVVCDLFKQKDPQ